MAIVRARSFTIQQTLPGKKKIEGGAGDCSNTSKTHFFFK